MKKLSKILLISAVVLTVVLPLSATAKRAVDPASARNKKLFVFKAERKFVGARVEVFSESGNVVTTQTMQKRKMFIDFSDVTEGVYTIRISKGDEVKEFHYKK